MIKMYFGVPGCGKTTFAVRNMIKDRKHSYVYCNFECSYPLIYDKFEPQGLGNWTVPEDSLIVIDEASCEWNNRSFKSFPPELIEYLKKHRHYRVDIDLISQSWDDVDITARRLVDELWYGKKLFFGITVWRRLFKTIDVETQHEKSRVGQIIDGYKKARIFSIFDRNQWQFCYGWHWYGFFNSFEKYDLKKKYTQAIKRRPIRKPWLKVAQDFYIRFHRFVEMLKCKVYCIKNDIALPSSL